MGVPKRRASTTKVRKRKAHWKKLSAPNLVRCPRCYEPMLPHRVCMSCGYYKGRQVLRIKEKGV